ncbi:UvrD-helicase domain-containing protein [Cryobacterium soli]|uniref:UvrD-helicase domain-containing protein n=1 Tax=Cryobacterium soli TaxID=2220095 RepID=UPI000E71442A|nr:UvrD-helicase domain-containing protein [Cryobacterium soli]
MTSRIGSPNTPVDLALHAHLDSVSPSGFIVRAGAGSGKTTSLIKALAHLIQSQGVALARNQQKIVCITYTDIAREEISRDVGEHPLVHVSTIHSFLWELCRPFKSDIGVWVSLSMQTKIDKLKDLRAGFASKPRTRPATIQRNQEDIDRAERQLQELDANVSYTYGISSNYQNGTLGHDDILKLGSQLLTTKPLLAQLVAQRYPFFFVDESQDTMPAVVEALSKVAAEHSDRFCLGFFGDPMQQIYATGVGDIDLPEGWVQFDKPENFRSSQAILAVINNIRSRSDDLVQTGGRIDKSVTPPVLVQGSARLFVLPTDGKRQMNLARVRQWLAAEHSDPLWQSADENRELRILVIVHRMAANRLGFPALYSAFNDKVPDKYGTSFQEGDGWLLGPITRFVLPLVGASDSGDKSEVMRILRAHCELLSQANLENRSDIAALFAQLAHAVKELSNMLSPSSGSSVRDLFKVIADNKLTSLDSRILVSLSIPATGQAEVPEGNGADPEDAELVAGIVERYFSCAAIEVVGYGEYTARRSPYATHQGVKGAEFERVVVVLDDEEGTHNQFSYDKLLGLTALSDTDLRNVADGKESVIGRTSRLLYVCCSRARRDLAVVLYTADPASAVAELKNSGMFERDDVLALEDLEIR